MCHALGKVDGTEKDAITNQISDSWTNLVIRSAMKPMPASGKGNETKGKQGAKIDV